MYGDTNREHEEQEFRTENNRITDNILRTYIFSFCNVKTNQIILELSITVCMYCVRFHLKKVSVIYKP